MTGKLALNAGWYQLDIRALSGATPVGNWTVDRVGVGEVLIVAGQSNAQGSSDGQDATDDRVSCVDAVNGQIREYQLQFKFRHLDGSASVGPTNNKHFYGALGDLLVQRLNVPVLLLGAAIGGTSSNQYAVSARGDFSTPDAQNWDWEQEMKPYRAIGATLNHYARRTGLRGILWFQGESDNGMVSGDTYFNNISTVINKTRSDLGYNVAWVISQTSYIAGVTDPAITGAQLRLASTVTNCFLGPNTDAWGAAFRDADNTHFSASQKGLLATLWNNALGNSFFSQSPYSRTDAPATVTTGLPYPARQYAGGHIYVGYMTTGNTVGASYSVQLLDGNGNYIANLGTASSNPIRVFLPDNLGAGRYRVKVVSSAAGNESTASDQFEVFDRGYGKGSGTGLTGAYYPNTSFAGNSVINRTEGPLDYTWVSPPSPDMPADNRNWTARWTGQVEAPVTGPYTIKALCDDGSRVYINGQPVIDDWTAHPWANVKYGTIFLEAGKKYDIKVELYQAWFDAQVRIYWALPGHAIAEYIPIDRLYPSTNPIVPPAQAPVLSGGFSPLQFTQNQAVQLNLPTAFTDPGNLPLTFSYQGLPNGITGNGLQLSGTPTTVGSGQFTITARNSANLTTSATVTYQVIPDPNNPQPTGSCAYPEGQYLFTTSWGESVYAHYYNGVLYAGYKDGSNFRPQHWLTATGKMTQTVANCFAENDPHTTPTAPSTTNHAPVVANTPTLVAGTQNSPYSASIPASTFTDPDGDALTYSIAGLPAGLSASGLSISGTPSTTGSATLTLRATDPKGLYAETTTTLMVLSPASLTQPAAGKPTPVVNPLDGRYEGYVDGKNCSTINGWVYNAKAGNDAVTIEFLAGTQSVYTYRADGFRQDVLNAGKGNGNHAYYIATPDGLKTGSAVNVTVRVKDAGYVLIGGNFTLSCPASTTGPVLATNRAPVVNSTPTLLAGTQNTAYSATIPTTTFTDPDGDALTYTISGLPVGLSASGLSISGTPTTAGTSTLILRATDPKGLYAETTVSLVINAASNTPVASNPMNGRYEGYVDWNNCSALGGWVYNANAGNDAVTLELVNNGQVLSSTLAQTFRGDLVSAGKGNGYHGYSFNVPTSVKTGSPVTLSVRVKDTGYVLINAPFTLTCPNGSRLAAPSEEEVATTFTAYPNPTRDILHIKVPARYQASTITLTLAHLTGQTQVLTASSTDSQTYTTDLGQLSPGLYLIRVDADQKPVTTLKILKQ